MLDRLVQSEQRAAAALERAHAIELAAATAAASAPVAAPAVATATAEPQAQAAVQRGSNDNGDGSLAPLPIVSLLDLATVKSKLATAMAEISQLTDERQWLAEQLNEERRTVEKYVRVAIAAALVRAVCLVRWLHRVSRPGHWRAGLRARLAGCAWRSRRSQSTLPFIMPSEPP